MTNPDDPRVRRNHRDEWARIDRLLWPVRLWRRILAALTAHTGGTP